MKIGIAGGSFNPIQKGHTRLANHLVKEGIVDMVLMMPCYKSLYNKEVLDGETRLKMIELANRLPQVQPFDWEIRNKIEGIGTYDVMKMIEKEFPDDELYFIIGLDNSQKVKTWLNGDRITKEFKFIVVPRRGTNTEDIWFMEPPHIFVNCYETDEISSTAAKEILGRGANPKEMLDSTVYNYIMEHNLYKGTP